ARHFLEFRRRKRALAPDWRETRRKQPGVPLAQWHVEHGGQAKHHLTARRGTAGLQEAEMALRGDGGAGERKLRLAAVRAPPAQPLAEGRKDMKARSLSALAKLIQQARGRDTAL